MLALLPVYGVQKGLDAETASLLLTMFVMGGVVGQIPIGILADKMDRRLLLGLDHPHCHAEHRCAAIRYRAHCANMDRDDGHGRIGWQFLRDLPWP